MWLRWVDPGRLCLLRAPFRTPAGAAVRRLDRSWGIGSHAGLAPSAAHCLGLSVAQLGVSRVPLVSDPGGTHGDQGGGPSARREPVSEGTHCPTCTFAFCTLLEAAPGVPPILQGRRARPLSLRMRLTLPRSFPLPRFCASPLGRHDHLRRR